MIDGRFDLHMLEVFAESPDRAPTPQPVLWALASAAVAALVLVASAVPDTADRPEAARQPPALQQPQG